MYMYVYSTYMYVVIHVHVLLVFGGYVCILLQPQATEHKLNASKDASCSISLVSGSIIGECFSGVLAVFSSDIMSCKSVWQL